MPSVESIRSRSARVVFEDGKNGARKVWELVKGFTLAVAEVEKWLDELAEGKLVTEQAGASGTTYLPEADEKKRRLLSEVFIWAILQIEAKQLYDSLLKARGVEIRSDASARGLLSRERAKLEKKLAKSEDLPEAVAWLQQESLFAKDLFDEFRMGWCPARPLFAKFEGLSSAVVRQILCTGIARWKSFVALSRKWEKDKAEVDAQLAKFALEHPQYEQIAPQFAALEQNPELSSLVRRLVNYLVRRPTQERLQLVSRSISASGEGKNRPNRLAIDLETLRKSAPQLNDYLVLHAEHEAIRLSLSEPPTKTCPHPTKSWVEPVFAGPDNSAWGWTQLHWPEAGKRRGSVCLRGVVANGASFSEKELTVVFDLGEALPRSVRHLNAKSQTIEVKHIDGSWREAKFGGLRLMVSSLSVNGGEVDPEFDVQNVHFELSFLLKEEVEQPAFLAARSPWELGQKLPVGAAVLSVALAGEKLFCAARTERTEDGFKPASVKFSGHESLGISVGRVAEANRHFASLQKKTGKLAKGREFGKGAAGRRSNLLDTLIDTAVAEVVAMARGREHRSDFDPSTGKRRKMLHRLTETPASVVLLPKVEGIRASLYRETGDNSGIRIVRLRWAMDRLKQRLAANGIRVWEVGDFGVYDLCSKCGEIGTRARIFTDSRGQKCFEIRRNGDHLVCTSCGTEGKGRVTAIAETLARNELASMTDPGRFERYRSFFNEADRPALRKTFLEFEERARRALLARGMVEVKE